MDPLTPVTPTLDNEGDYAREAERRHDLWMCCEEDLSLRQYVLDRCKSDPWWFVTTFIWATHPDTGPVPVLDIPFQRDFAEIILGLNGKVNDRGRRYSLGAYKSRGVGGTVIACGCTIWEWLFKTASTSFWVSLREQNVDTNKGGFNNHIFGKLRFMIQSLPVWMRPSAWRESDKPHIFDSKGCLTNPDNGSVIQGLSTSENGIRGGRADRVYVDEANSITFLSALMRAADQVGPVCLISSVAGRKTTFAKYIHGEVVPIAKEPGDPGIMVRRMYYGMMPHLDLTTEVGRARVKSLRDSSTLSDAEWACEMETEFDALLEGQIWAAHINDVNNLTLPAYRKWLVKEGDAHTIVAWDFGSGRSYSVALFATYYPESDTIIIDDYHQWSDQLIDEMMEDLWEANWYTPQGRRPDFAVGDSSGNAAPPKYYAGEKLNTTKSWKEQLKEHGVNYRPMGSMNHNITKAIALVAKRFKEGKILFSPASRRAKQKYPKRPSAHECCKMYSLVSSSEDVESKPKKDKYSHVADALQMIVWAIEKGMVA